MAGRAMRSVCRRPWVARAKKQATEKAAKEAIAAAKAEAEAEARQPHSRVLSLRLARSARPTTHPTAQVGILCARRALLSCAPSRGIGAEHANEATRTQS